MSRDYPRWGGIDSVAAALGRRVPMKYRACAMCGGAATRIGTVEHTWSRSDDELFGLCPSNLCRDQLKAREGVGEPFAGVSFSLTVNGPTDEAGRAPFLLEWMQNGRARAQYYYANVESILGHLIGDGHAVHSALRGPTNNGEFRC